VRFFVPFVERKPGSRSPTTGDPFAEERGLAKTGGSRDQGQPAVQALVEALDEAGAGDDSGLSWWDVKLVVRIGILDSPAGGLCGPEGEGLVLYPLRPAFEDEVVEVRERLGKGEDLFVERERLSEHGAGDLEGRFWTDFDLRVHHMQPLFVVA
jgi:hypothetical protein